MAGAALCPGLPAGGDQQGPRPDPPGAEAPAGTLDRRECLRRPLADEGRGVDRAAMVERARSSSRGSTCVSPATRKVQVSRPRSSNWSRSRKALAFNAKLLILDEPTAALGGAETEALFEQVRKLRAEGVGIIYISHRAGGDPARLPIASSYCATASGWRDFADSATPVRTVVESMVGPKPGADVSADPATEGPMWCWRCRASPGRTERSGTSPSRWRRARSCGIAGLVGAGRTELVRRLQAPTR